MKWKVLLRFLLFLILSAVLIFTINLFVAYRFLNVQKEDSQENWSGLNSFTLDFRQYVVVAEGKPQITSEGREQLALRQGWIQILDEEGYEVFQWNKPPEAPEHYAPSEMVFYNIYTGALGNYTTFAGTAQIDGYQWSYIIGFPMENVAKYTFIYSPHILRINLIEGLVCIFIVPIVVFLVMGYLFGRSVANPVIHILGAIQQLDQGRYDNKYREKGLYKDVYRSLNHLAYTLKKSEVERQKMEQMREEWIQNLSHDLKTPLASVKGYGLLADAEYALTAEEVKKYARIIVQKAQYLEELLEDLKLTQAIKRGLIPLNCEKKDLVELLRDITIDVLNNPKYQHRKIWFNPQQEQIIFSFDATLLRRAFTNLIYNAVVHNHEDTEISITIEQKEKIVVEIADNGRGIPPQDLANLFARYYRGTNTGESHKGSGLGLNIAKQIIEVHGGEIKAESTLGVGTKITVIF